MRRLIPLGLSLACACSAPLGSPDASAVDAGHDAPFAARDVGSDTGFDPAVLGTCTLPHPDSFVVAPHTRLSSGDAIADRDFYVLTVLEQLAGVRAAIDGDASLAAIASARETALRDADAASCDPACVRAALVRSDDASAIEATLGALTSASLLDEVAAELRASYQLERFVLAGADDEALVRTALAEALANLASALDAYALGELPPATLASLVHDETSAAAGSLAWWQPLAHVTSHAMQAAGRDEAVRYEPIATGENAAAIAAIATTDFGAFPFVAILVPGQGPTDATTALNPAGAARCDLAYARFHAGLAPFFVLSGGHVHPDRTIYSEAIEMKRYLMTTYDVPESAILVDPYARHTTTNLRDVTRELFSYGAPTDGHVLVVTDAIQSIYIASDGFATRCDDELHFRPFLGLQVLTPTDTCMTMTPASLTIAASDPLDP